MEEDIKNADNEADNLNKEIIKEEKVLADIMESIKGKTTPIAAKIEVKQKELAPIQVSINDAVSKLKLLQQERDLANERAEAANNDRLRLKSELEELIAAFASKVFRSI